MPFGALVEGFGSWCENDDDTARMSSVWGLLLVFKISSRFCSSSRLDLTSLTLECSSSKCAASGFECKGRGGEGEGAERCRLACRTSCFES